MSTETDDGACPRCGRDAYPASACACCKRCGSTAQPCACDFDLSTAEGRRDYAKYGEAFIPVEPLKMGPFIRWTAPPSERPHSLIVPAKIEDTELCGGRKRWNTFSYPELGVRIPPLSRENPGFKAFLGAMDVEGACGARVRVRRGRITSRPDHVVLQCTRAKNHEGRHRADHGFEWDPEEPERLPLARTLPKKKSILRAIARVFLRVLRHRRGKAPRTGQA